MMQVASALLITILSIGITDQRCAAPQEVAKLEYCGEPGKPANFCNHIPMDTITVMTAGQHVCNEFKNLKKALKKQWDKVQGEQ